MPVEVDLGALDLARWLRPGDGVVWGQACAEPEPLVRALLAQSASIGPLRGFIGLTWSSMYEESAGDTVALSSYATLGRTARVAAARPVDVVPCHYSALPRLFAEGVLACDVLMVQVAPPGPDGTYSMGVCVEYYGDLVAGARVVIAEVNDQMPRTFGTALRACDIDVVVPTARPLIGAQFGAPGDVERVIAALVAERVRDGDTIQFGVGALPDAILGALGSHRRLGVHSGMVSDAVLDLVDAGVVDGSEKPRDRGLAVAGAALGSVDGMARLHEHPGFSFRPVSYTHAPAVSCTAGRLVALNGGIEVDLLGQVGAEAVGGRALGGIGGQVDFLRAAAASGGEGVVALQSVTGRAATRIVASLGGPVTTGRADVDLVVTEHGVAELRGRTSSARARALIAVADPSHRDTLQAAARERGLL